MGIYIETICFIACWKNLQYTSVPQGIDVQNWTRRFLFCRQGSIPGGTWTCLSDFPCFFCFEGLDCITVYVKQLVKNVLCLYLLFNFKPLCVRLWLSASRNLCVDWKVVYSIAVHSIIEPRECYHHSQRPICLFCYKTGVVCEICAEFSLIEMMVFFGNFFLFYVCSKFLFCQMVLCQWLSLCSTICWKGHHDWCCSGLIQSIDYFVEYTVLFFTHPSTYHD